MSRQHGPHERRTRTIAATSIVSVFLVACAASSVPSMAAGVPRCFGKKATITATNRNPNRSVTLRGTSGDDVIVGLGGSERIEAFGGDDLVCARGGDDYVVAGRGDDKVKGRADSDTIIGGTGSDRIWGGGDSDGLLGGPGADRIFGGAGDQDSLVGGAGNDALHGGSGYDVAEFWDSPVGVHADLTGRTATGHGGDVLVSIEGLVGSNHDDLLIGNELSNDLQGGDGNDVIRALGSSGDDGMDILRSAGGDSVLDGGEGPDIASYNLVPWAVAVDLAAGTTTTDGFGMDMLVDIEHVTGSKENDSVIGDESDNVIIGNGGDDFMDGGGGTDEAAFFESRVGVTADLASRTATAGWWGSDTLINFESLAGSMWRDALTGDEGPNLIWGGDRADSISGLTGDDVLIGGAGSDEANGGADSDACDAETELHCESEPATAAYARHDEPFFWASLRDSSILYSPAIVFVRDLPPRKATSTAQVERHWSDADRRPRTR